MQLETSKTFHETDPKPAFVQLLKLLIEAFILFQKKPGSNLVNNWSAIRPIYSLGKKINYCIDESIWLLANQSHFYFTPI